MKKSILIFTLLSLFLCSCDKYEITESISGIEGTWKLKETLPLGCFGDPFRYEDVDCSLIFEEGNLLSFKHNDEFIVYQEKFRVTKPKNIPQATDIQTPANEYLIELPKKVRNAIIENVRNEYQGEIQIYVDGYASISADEYDGIVLTIRSSEEYDILFDHRSRYVR